MSLSSLDNYIVEQIETHGYKKVLLFPLVPLTVLSALGVTLIGPNSGYLGLAAALGYLAFLLVVQRHAWHKRGDELRDVKKYLKSVSVRTAAAQASNRDYFEILSWKESIRVGKRGDSRIVTDYHLKAGSTAMDSFSTVRLATEDVADVSKVSFVARIFNPDGSVGVRRLTEVDWETRSRMRVFVYFEQPILPGAEFTVRLEWTWPRYCRVLVDGSNEKQAYQLTRKCKSLTCTTTFDAASNVAPRIIASLLSSHGSVDVTRPTSSEAVVKYHVDNPPRDAPFGFEVDSR